MGKRKTQAETMLEIAYAAFSTHFRTVYAAKLTEANAHAEAQKHWNDNLPGVQILWTGLARGILANVTEAQRNGLLPDPMPGLGAPLAGVPLPGLGQQPDTTPAALARRLASQLGAQTGRFNATDPNLSQMPSRAEPTPEEVEAKLEAYRRETYPGLAIGRDTESDTDSDN